MNKKQKLLVNLLSAAIRNTKPQVKCKGKVNLEALFKEAKAHQVDALLYTTLKNMEPLQDQDNFIMAQWEKDTVLKGIVQIQHIKQINKVLNKFSQTDIPVIVLKGLVLRCFYPRPEFRSMTDADILVHRENIEQAKELLLKMGYTVRETSATHIHFAHPSYLPIELHWKLTNDEYIKDTACFEPYIWERALPIQPGGSHALMLSWEDQIVHLCLHMAVHILYSGFGLRQLCDLVLLIDNKGERINWGILNEKLKACGIERFTSSIFMVCNELLGMKMPYSINLESAIDKHCHKLLIDEIFAGGVFGKKNLLRIYSLDLLEHSTEKGRDIKFGKLMYFISLIFPSCKILSEKFAYAKRLPLLIPVAWFHYCLCGIRNRNLSIFEKGLFLFSTMTNSKKRSKLLQWLDLQ